ncbi:MAG TPA: hypothetical protein PKE27_02060 [Povalibacter sp.]|uniref:hypothetical protein n=1 Tax=Povalibacter sp. TaxID=1962978 RepID=UPI002B64112E|nr:hypothetical protein [Povalibacter sp.]HMN43325.1 hypothetical protein [Povalibacter sp.]
MTDRLRLLMAAAALTVPVLALAATKSADFRVSVRVANVCSMARTAGAQPVAVECTPGTAYRMHVAPALTRSDGDEPARTVVTIYY